jgi:superfamily II DNA or RNA helicase
MFNLSEKKVNELRDLLWDHQNTAINQMVQYINSYKEKPTNKSALVQMPTGSGKSGVITVLSTFTQNIRFVLVLTPRSSLRDQLHKDINGRFYNRIKFKLDGEIPKTVLNIRKGLELELENSEEVENLIVIMTFSMLQSIAKNRESIFNILKKKVSLILVDEGHYEPAKKWSKLVRKEIKAPKILFTATPYRNDFQVFDIDLDYIFTFSFKSAVKERYIRDIEIINRLLDKFTPDSFIDDVVEFYHQQFPKFSLYENIEDFNKDPDEMQEKILEKPRIIIRCDESISIKHLAKALDDRNIRCVGIHDTFKEHEDWERKKVPSIDDKYAMKADVWIHQFKLLEGIDDSRFQVLAIYERIRSARPLVQQIGRIIRNPRREDGAKGYFLEHWDGYGKTAKNSLC